MNEWRHLVQFWERFGPEFRVIAIVLLLLGSAALVVAMGWVAIAKLESEIGSLW